MIEIIQQAPVASFLFAITILSSLYVFAQGDNARKWMLHPYSVHYERRYLPILTSGFIHADLAHLAFNMFTFYFFAFPLEQIMVVASGPIGHVFFGIVYILSMILADISTIFRQKDNPSYYSLGASGAVSGIIFSFILFYPTASFYLFFIPVPIPAPVFGLLYIIYSVVSARGRHDNINHEAHLWGAVAGFLLTLILFDGIWSHFLSEVTSYIQEKF